MTSEESHLINQYLNGKLSVEETSMVEKRMSDDVRFRESVLLEKQLFDAVDSESWSFVGKVEPEKLKAYKELSRSSKIQDIQSTINAVNSEYQNSQSRPKKSFWKMYAAAAAALIICALLFLLPKTKTTDELYASALDLTELPSLVYRSDDASEKLLAAAQEAFENKKYKEALELIEGLKVQDEPNSTLLLYKGIAEMELEHYTEAQEIFESLATSGLIDAPKGQWYKALLYLKKDDVSAAQTALKMIIEIPTHYKSNAAKRLLEALDITE